MWEQGSVQGFIIFSAPQRRGEKYMFEYFFYDNEKIFATLQVSRAFPPL